MPPCESIAKTEADRVTGLKKPVVFLVTGIRDALDGRDRVAKLVEIDLERHLRGQGVRKPDDLDDTDRPAIGQRHEASDLTPQDRAESDGVSALLLDQRLVFRDDECDETL